MHTTLLYDSIYKAFGYRETLHARLTSLRHLPTYLHFQNQMTNMLMDVSKSFYGCLLAAAPPASCTLLTSSADSLV